MAALQAALLLYPGIRVQTRIDAGMDGIGSPNSTGGMDASGQCFLASNTEQAKSISGWALPVLVVQASIRAIRHASSPLRISSCKSDLSCHQSGVPATST
jgi:hypothetical protein